MKNHIYKIWDKIEEHKIVKYYAELEFSIEDKKFIANMPFIIHSLNEKEAKAIKNQIINELRNQRAIQVKEIAFFDITYPESYNRELSKVNDRFKSTPDHHITIETLLNKKSLKGRTTLLNVDKDYEKELLPKKTLDFIVIKDELDDIGMYKIIVNLTFDKPSK